MTYFKSQMNPIALRASARRMLEENILPFWQERMVDNEHGGFYGRIDGHDILHSDAPKGAILNARILWTFSAACRVLHKTEYRIMAARAYDYLMLRFVDREFGGVYWSLNADGTPLDTKKQTYAIAFVMYGLAEYARLTGDEDAKRQAISLFHDIERHAFDATNVGYVEALTRDWQPIADMRLSEKDENGSRTMNTHLHVLEAYTCLYRIWPDEQLEKQLRTLVNIFVTRIYNPENGHLDLFFDDCWRGKRDKHSPGHDIEASWLLQEAIEVLGDEKLLQQTLPVIHHLAQASEEGIMKESQWWCYAEAVVGFYNQYQLYKEDKPAESIINYEMAEAAYEYITTHLVDYVHGEWHWGLMPDGSVDRENDKAGFWKCPYHNSRMCLEILERV